MMKPFYKVNPNTAPIIQIMDSSNPYMHSLKYKNISGLLHLPDSVLKKIKGAYTEVILERIRRVAYPQAPSRLTGIFLWEYLEEAKKYRVSGWTEPNGLISAYEIVELYSPVFIGDISLVNILANLRAGWPQYKNGKSAFIRSTLEESLSYISHCYWQGKTAMDLGLSTVNSMREVLVDGKVAVLSYVPL